MRDDGRDEETPNKKLRSHSSGTPMQSPEQNISFAEMFANIGATPSEAPTVEVGMVFSPCQGSNAHSNGHVTH